MGGSGSGIVLFIIYYLFFITLKGYLITYIRSILLVSGDMDKVRRGHGLNSAFRGGCTGPQMGLDRGGQLGGGLHCDPAMAVWGAHTTESPEGGSVFSVAGETRTT